MGDVAERKTVEQLEDELMDRTLERDVAAAAAKAAVEPIYLIAKELSGQPARQRVLEDAAECLDTWELAVPEAAKRQVEFLDREISRESIIRETVTSRPAARAGTAAVLVAELVAARAANHLRLKEIDQLPAEGDVPGYQTQAAGEIIDEVQGKTIDLQHRVFLWIIEGKVDPVAAAEAMTGVHSIDQELV